MIQNISETKVQKIPESQLFSTDIQRLYICIYRMEILIENTPRLIRQNGWFGIFLRHWKVASCYICLYYYTQRKRATVSEKKYTENNFVYSLNDLFTFLQHGLQTENYSMFTYWQLEYLFSRHLSTKTLCLFDNSSKCFWNNISNISRLKYEEKKGLPLTLSSWHDVRKRFF